MDASRSTVELRAAHDRDFDTVAQVWHESASLPGVGPPVMPTPSDLRARMDRELAAGWQLTVAVYAGEIVGLLAIKPDTSMLDQLFVGPSFRGAGVGMALLRHAMAHMPGGFTLHTASTNHHAKRFYERAGLNLIRDGDHPLTGHPVSFYRWQGR